MIEKTLLKKKRKKKKKRAATRDPNLAWDPIPHAIENSMLQ